MNVAEFSFRYVHDQFSMTTDVDVHWQSIKSIYAGYFDAIPFNRHYHNMDHVEEMCIWLWFNFDCVNDDTLPWILWAAIYHDLVDPKLSDGVELSAEKSDLDLRIGLPNGPYDSYVREKKIAYTHEAIMATKGHVTDNYEHQFLVDADLRRFTCEVGYSFEYFHPVFDGCISTPVSEILE